MIWRSQRAGAAQPYILALVAYAVAFVVAVKIRGLSDPDAIYWAGWADQRQYLASATAFHVGDLSTGRHWYPLLYPMVAAPFIGVLPNFPFAAVNATCFLLTFHGFRQVATGFGVSRWAAFAIFVATTVFYPQVGNRWIEPWTTTLSSALIWLALGTAVAILADPTRADGGRAVLIGGLLALIPLARPADAVISAAVAVALAGRLVGHPAAWRFISLAGATGTLLVAAYGLLHLAIYGPAASDYMTLSAAYGFNPAWLGWKAYVILIEPTPWFPGGKALLRACPWLIVGAAGLLVAAARRGVLGRAARMMLCASLLYLAVMLAYVDLLPSGLWRYNNVHYFKWLLPLFGLFAWIGLRDAGRAPRRFVAVLATLLVASGVRIGLQTVDERTPARAIAYPAPPAEFADLYMARSVVADGVGPQRNVVDYHQIPAPGATVLAVALKRSFVERAEWRPRAPTAVAWPIMAPGSLSASPTLAAAPHGAIGRFGHRVAIGWPCWLPPYACDVAGWQAATGTGPDNSLDPSASQRVR